MLHCAFKCAGHSLYYAAHCIVQTALQAKAKGSPGYRFYLLYDKLYRKDVLEYAYRCCKANRGAPGVDQQDFADIEVYGEGRWLGELADKLRGRTYRPEAVRRNGSRCRLWKVALQELVRGLGIPIHVSHFPPGTSKWNKIEHRMFCHITQNWRGRPLVSHEVIVNLIANVTTRTGLKIRAELDRGTYPSGIKVSEAEFQTLHLKPHPFHGDWNYALLPGRKKK